jgi:hypothetical protein
MTPLAFGKATCHGTGHDTRASMSWLDVASGRAPMPRGRENAQQFDARHASAGATGGEMGQLHKRNPHHASNSALPMHTSPKAPFPEKGLEYPPDPCIMGAKTLVEPRSGCARAHVERLRRLHAPLPVRHAQGGRLP